MANLRQKPKAQRGWIRLLILCLALPFGLTGCCHWTDQSGTRHTLIIGVGVVSVNESKPEAAQVTRANALGIMADAGGVTAGLSSRFTTSVAVGTNDVWIEASLHPVGQIRIEAHQPKLNQTNQGIK